MRTRVQRRSVFILSGALLGFGAPQLGATAGGGGGPGSKRFHDDRSVRFASEGGEASRLRLRIVASPGPASPQLPRTFPTLVVAGDGSQAQFAGDGGGMAYTKSREAPIEIPGISPAFEELAQLFEHEGAAIVAGDLDGILTYCNPAFARLTGYERESVVGMTPWGTEVRWRIGSRR